MKKILVILITLLCLTGCSKDYKIYKTYKNYYQDLLKTDIKSSTSENFNVQLVKNELEDDNYRYDIIIDNPKIEMRDIVALAIVDNGEFDKENMMPSLGIFDDKYSLIPNDIDLSQLKAKGLNLSIVLKEEKVQFKLFIEYTNTEGKIVKEYLIIS